ncbi:MAG: hypothetical protein LJE66_14365 [Desulfobacterales bacterium]|nr:hypothetical protein [Desulfobacterales bacterium]
MILAKQTGCFAPGCKSNVESTDVLLSFQPMAENSSHPPCGWQLTPHQFLAGEPEACECSLNRKKGVAIYE